MEMAAGKGLGMEFKEILWGLGMTFIRSIFRCCGRERNGQEEAKLFYS